MGCEYCKNKMSCEYCRGEKPLFDDMGYDGGWHAGIYPADGTMTARFEAGELYNDAYGTLELDIEYCPKCGTRMLYVMEKFSGGAE